MPRCRCKHCQRPTPRHSPASISPTKLLLDRVLAQHSSLARPTVLGLSLSFDLAAALLMRPLDHLPACAASLSQSLSLSLSVSLALLLSVCCSVRLRLTLLAAWQIFIEHDLLVRRTQHLHRYRFHTHTYTLTYTHKY